MLIIHTFMSRNLLISSSDSSQNPTADNDRQCVLSLRKCCQWPMSTIGLYVRTIYRQEPIISWHLNISLFVPKSSSRLSLISRPIPEFSPFGEILGHSRRVACEQQLSNALIDPFFFSQILLGPGDAKKCCFVIEFINTPPTHKNDHNWIEECHWDCISHT